MAAEPVRSTAHAKINLALHITGRRPDGYHLIDSAVAFADVGDGLTVAPADYMSLTISGPFAAEVPAGPGNLVLAAAGMLAADARLAEPGAAITLDKRLPVAAGIGGGSADAAAALRLLAELWTVDVDLHAIATRLGADVPMCLSGRPSRASGIGEVLAPMPALPGLAVVLANPGVPLATGRVFAGLGATKNAPLPEPGWHDRQGFFDWLARTRNDLVLPALELAPEIARLTDALEAVPGCRFARMSGSGSTCFGLFDTLPEADAAAECLKTSGSADWVVAARLRG